jgi:hypothetical protein
VTLSFSTPLDVVADPQPAGQAEVTVLSLDPGCTSAAMVELALRDGGLAGVQRVDDPADAAIGPVIVLYDDAVPAIARDMAAGGALQPALADWHGAAEVLARFCRTARRRVSLIERGALRRDPGAALTAACTRLGLDAPASGPWQDATETGDPAGAGHDMLLLIAAQAVAQSIPTARLADEMQALALPVGTFAQVPIDRLEAARQDVARMASLPAEHTALGARLAETTSALARAEKMAADADAEVKMQTQLLLSVQRELENGFVALNAAREESKRMDLARSVAEDALARRDAELADARADLVRRDAELADARAEQAERDAYIAALLGSTSWRLTEPMRRLKRAVTR